jgi:hypothetical protein
LSVLAAASLLSKQQIAAVLKIPRQGGTMAPLLRGQGLEELRDAPLRPLS